jgi:hypothetical protein
MKSALPHPRSEGAVRHEERFSISDPSRQAGPPAVRFVDGRWLVAWQSMGAPPIGGDPVLELAMIDEATQAIDRRVGPPLANWWPHLRFDEHGRLGVLSDDGQCVHQLYELDLSTQTEAFDIPCGRDAHLAVATPVPNSDEWMIAYGGGKLVDSVFVGRYRPSSGVWVVPPIALGERGEDTSLAIFAYGSQGLVLWGAPSGTTLRTIDALAQAAIANLTVYAFRLDSPISIERTSAPDSGFAFAQLDRDAVLLGIDAAGLWSLELDSPHGAVPHQVAESGVLDRPPAAAAAAERGVIGVCYPTADARSPGPAGSANHDNGVAFALLDREGELIGEPSVIATDLENIGGCDVAWSGKEFLVVYWQIDLAPDQHAEFTSEIFGRFMRIDE